MNLKKNGKVFTSKSVGTGPSSYEKRIYRAAVSQRLRNTALDRTLYTKFFEPIMNEPFGLSVSHSVAKLYVKAKDG